MSFLRRYAQFLLLGFVPIAIGLELTVPENHTRDGRVLRCS
jgi:hypothetical protein